ncbi:eukaryotic translation initiation factor 4E, putative; 82364-84055 [Arabidopsis thaliana]|nr:eukaryotic translation initiation factor 4E, putative; 82364-84055 [Arabidopsis thaliana]
MEQYWALYKELTLSHLRLLYWERTRRSIVNGKITVKRAREKEKSEMVVMDSPVSGRMADQNIDPNTTTSPSPIEKHVSAIKAISGDEKAPSKEKKNYASKKSTTVIQKSHCFQNSWTFWFDNPSSKSNQVIWGSSLRSLYTFATIEEFWSLYNNIHPPTKWVSGSDLYCFKDKIEPKWEDPICANGGKWTMFFPRATLESNWLNTLLALVGEQFDQGDEICGAVLNFRTRGDRISLWTKKAANEEAQLSIGKQWKELLGYNDTIGFIVHEDAKTLDRDAKRRYTV